MPAYVIMEVSIHDPEEIVESHKLTPPTVAAFNGKFVVRGEQIITLEGDWKPERIVVIEVAKMVVNGDDTFVIINGWTTDGKLFRNIDYFKFKDGKSKEYECFFGPEINYPNSGK